MADNVFVFIDNSNMFIQGTHAIAALEDAGKWDAQRTTRQLTNARIDYGALLRVVLKERHLGGVPLLVGSRPPPNDTLWEKLKAQGLEVKVFDRNAANKEKKVDTFIVAEVMETLYTASPGGPGGCTVALVAGDGDYEPLADKIVAKGWNLEVYFWRTGAGSHAAPVTHVAHVEEPAVHMAHTCACQSIGLSQSLSKYCNALDDMYKEFTFATGSEFSKGRPNLVISAPEFGLIKNETVLQTIVQKIGGVFGWWDWVADTELKMFFRDGQQQKRALTWFKANNPDWIVFQSS